ncbi:MAG: site-specific integrase [Candidatus Eisenbacteria bacterium]
MASVTQTGPNSWRVLIRLKGHEPICKTFRTEERARKFGKDTEREIRTGRAPKASGPTVDRAVEIFRELRDSGPRPINPKSNEHYMLVHLERDLKGKAVDDLTPQALADFCKKRALDGANPYTVGMEVSKLGTVLKYAAISLNRVLPDVVGAAMPLLEYSGLVGPGTERDRRPTQTELDAILDKLPPMMRDIVQFAVATAMRRGEISRILWADVDHEKKCVLIRDRKHPRKKKGNHQWVPMLDVTGYDAWAILNRQPKTDERIFPANPQPISEAFLLACRAAGVMDLTFHDLRHEATSRLFESGMTIEQVPLVTGHEDWRHLKRYTHLRPEHLHAPDPGTPRGRARPRTARPRPGTSAG